MRVLAACSLGGAGHLLPLLRVLEVARAEGHETLVAPAALAELVAESGHAFQPGGAPPEEAIAPIRERLPLVEAQEAAVLGNRELFGMLAAPAMMPAAQRTIEAWRPKLILRDPCEYASAAVAERLGVRTAQVAISLAAVEEGSITAAAPALEELARGMPGRLRASPYLSRFPASLDPSPFADTRRFSDPAPAEAPSPLPDFWGGSREPLIYVSFGTVVGHMSIAAELYESALEALAHEPHTRVLVSVGRHFDAAVLSRPPANVRIVPWVDQRSALAEAQVVVSHGGSGTTYGALAAGVPVIVAPVFGDQFANGRAVARAGAGVVLARGGAITPALMAVRSQPYMRERAREIAAEMARAPSPGAVLAELLAEV